MRIISGKYKSRRVNLPKGNKKKEQDNLIRPTSDRARETLFDVLSNFVDFDGLKCLDLFAGTGALGLEAISRGAEACDFVDVSKDSAAAIGKTTVELGCSSNSKIIRKDALRFLSAIGEIYYDIVFADPPYSYEKYDLLEEAVIKIKPQLFVLETSRELKAEYKAKGYNIIEKETGAAKFTIFTQN